MAPRFGLAALQGAPRKTLNNPYNGCLVNASCTYYDNRVVLFGGFHMYTDEVYNDLLTYSFKNHSWQRMRQVVGHWPSPRSSHSATYWKDGKIVIFGGTDTNYRLLNDLYILDMKTAMWTKPDIGGDPPSGRMKHSAVIHDDILYIAGGCANLLSDSDDISGSLYVLDLQNLEWRDEYYPFVHRHSHFSFVHRERLYIYGGFDRSLDCRSDISYMDLNTMSVNRVEIISDDTPPHRGQPIVQLCKDSLVATFPTRPPSNENMSSEAGIWILDLDCFEWTSHRNDFLVDPHFSWDYALIREDSQQLCLFGDDDRSIDESNIGFLLTIDLDGYEMLEAPPPSLGNDLTQLFQSGEFADFSIICAGSDSQPIRVHRLILATRWPHFKNLCAAGMTEATTSTLTLDEPDFTVREFLLYLYSDSVGDVNINTLCDLVLMANRYCLERLQKLICLRLQNRMDMEHVALVYVVACVVNDEGLRSRSFKMILEHFGTVAKTLAFRKLTPDQLDYIWDNLPSDSTIQLLPS
ncbi:hypothetical protein DFS34DRAFT_713646 [Phlyctochytrium arcticum]|nr:hypothetical protein DFS34DRAFT_713646 [Phlyctochytrium arcticum]